MGKSKPSSQSRQTLILWALLVKESGSAFQGDLKPEPSKADRDALVRDGLVAVTRVGPKRRVFLEVTDKGWQWAGEHLDAPLPANSPAGSKILEAWLTHLKGFLAAHRFVLADVFGAQSPSTDGDLWTRLRAAYLEATGGKLNARALLKDIRAKLNIDRQTFDTALKAFQAEAKLQLYPSDNRLELTEADKAAAVMIGGEPRHILWIEQ